MAGFDPDEEIARIEGSVGEEDELLEHAEESPQGGARERLTRSRRSSIAPGRRCARAANDGAKPS